MAEIELSSAINFMASRNWRNKTQMENATGLGHMCVHVYVYMWIQVSAFFYKYMIEKSW